MSCFIQCGAIEGFYQIYNTILLLFNSCGFLKSITIIGFLIMWFIFYCLISGETSPIKSVSEKTLFMHFTVSINCFMILQLENHENHIGWKWKEIMCLNSYSITWILQQVSNTLLRYDKNLLINKHNHFVERKSKTFKMKDFVLNNMTFNVLYESVSKYYIL